MDNKKADQCKCPGSVIPASRRSDIYNKLHTLNKLCDTKVVIDQKDGDDLVLVGVAAMDWPGLATVVLSELHHYGWNLDILEGFALKSEGLRRGYVITGILEGDSERRDRFIADAGKMADLLARLAQGRAGTVSLLSRAAERLERFEEVRTALESLYGDENIPSGVLGEKGELVLFISSRSDEYLAERNAMDLAWIIRSNFQLVNQVTIFDVYSGEQIPPGKKSLAYRIIYQSPTHTLTDEEVNEVQQQILDKLSQELGTTLRS